MLEVGNGGMTYQEYRAHFSIWALMKVTRMPNCHDNENLFNVLCVFFCGECILITQPQVEPFGALQVT